MAQKLTIKKKVPFFGKWNRKNSLDPLKSLSLRRGIWQNPPNKSHRYCPVGLDYLGTWEVLNLALQQWLPVLATWFPEVDAIGCS